LPRYDFALAAVAALVLACGAAAPARAQTGPSASPWQPLTNASQIGFVQLLTDATLIGPVDHFRFTPDINGSYVNGTFSQTAPLPSGYMPGYFASAVLPDGRLIVEGGETNNGVSDLTNLGAIYDPVADSWTSVSPPSGWSTIGGAPSVVLPNGTFMIGQIDATGYIGTRQ
jgi:hypothetical protein